MAVQHAEELIALPRGGGAQSGIGETFRPDLHTGTANLTVPLRTPAGRAGLQPSLALTYSSGNPNGPFGLGWALSLPGVRRRTSRGVPRYDGGDVFVLSGAEDLTPVPSRPGDGPGVTRYRPRVESGYARIVHVRDDRGDYWEVHSPGGLRSRYGTPRPAGAPANWSDPAVVVTPAGQVFAWLVSETSDPLGNRLVHEYRGDPDGGAQRYLSRIRYVDVGDPAEDRFLVGVEFGYATRPDPLVDRRGGFALRTTLRATGMTTWTAPDGVPVTGFRVAFRYADEQGDAPAGGVSLLARVEPAGVDGERTQQLPPTEFGYTGWRPDRRRLLPVTGPLPATALGGPLDLVDLFGDGLPSLLSLDGAARYWRNTGDGRFALPRPLAAAPAGVRLGAPGVLLADVDGDGRPELVADDGRHTASWTLAAAGGRAGFVPAARAATGPPMPLTEPRVRLVDLDGDGRMDLLRGEDRWYAADNDGRGGFGPLRALPDAPPVALTDPRVRLADMTGDGLTDVVRVHDGRVVYWPALGRGRYDRPVTMRGAPRFGGGHREAGFDPRRLLVGDVTGDGAADLVHVADGRLTVWLNQGGTGFAEPVVITGTPRVDDTTQVRLVDLLGAGVSGVLWSADAGRPAPYRFLDLTGGVKPYLLTSVDNHHGAVTTITYATSTGYALADARAGRPWRTTLPFPVHVVRSVRVEDRLSGTASTSEFSYHHGYWDGVDREFRGFARVEQRDTLTGVPGGSPPVLVRSWFHPGPVGPADGGEPPDLGDEYWPGDPPLAAAVDVDALPGALAGRGRRDALRAVRGVLLRRETYAEDGSALADRPYEVADSAYRVVPVTDGRAGDDPSWLAAPVVAAEGWLTRTVVWQRGDEPMTRVTVAGPRDGYGRSTVDVALAVARGRDPRAATPGPGFLGTVTTTRYATRDDADGYLVDRVTRSRREEVVDPGGLTLLGLAGRCLATAAAETGPVRALELTYYDGPAHVGLPAGQLGGHGLVTRVERLALTTDLLVEASRAGDGSGAVPPYLSAAPGDWPVEYPPGFVADLPAHAGYHWHDADDAHTAGWYVETGSYGYDVHDAATGRGLLTAVRDPLGAPTRIDHDAYDLLPVRVTEPGGLVRTAEYDYRLLHPSRVTDANGVSTLVTYTPLGQPATTALLGRPGSRTGDTPEQPGTTYHYDLAGDGRPLSVRTVRRIDHRWSLVARADADRAAAGAPPLTDDEIAALFPADELTRYPERFTVTVEYSDGFGRLVQARSWADEVVVTDLGLAPTAGGDAGPVVAEADPQRVTVTGARAYDDKGRVVRAWEPYHDTGLAYAPPTADRLAGLAAATTTYDPRGVAVAVTGPDGSQSVRVPGVPLKTTDPTGYRPTPWETYHYDPDDNAGRTHPDEARAWSHQWNTPSSATVDPLGRTVLAVDHRGDGEPRRTATTYDVDGALLTVTDALGRLAARHTVDLLGRVWRTWTIDGGVTRTVHDAAGNVVETRDDRGGITLDGYDARRRPRRRWAAEQPGVPATLRTVVCHGDDPESGWSRQEAAARHALGRVAASHDEAGLVRADRYDLAGNLVRRSRRVLRTDVLLAGLPAGAGDWSGTAPAVDWTPPDGGTLADREAALLDPTELTVEADFDALGRCRATTTPVQADGTRSTLSYGYTRGGALTRLAVDGVEHLRRVVYDAGGRRTLALLGNGTMVRYDHDPATFRLRRLRAEPATATGELSWAGAGAATQDLGYGYDLVGNLLRLTDRTPGCGVPGRPEGPDTLVRDFGYDGWYRLTSATGRQTATGPKQPWLDRPAPVDVTLAEPYREEYGYDAVGNLLSLAHRAATGWTRTFTLAPGGNRLAGLTVGDTTFDHAHDAAGNLLVEGGVRRYEWDHARRCATFRVQTGTAVPSLYAQYRYDSAGARVVKLVRRGGRVDVTWYLDGFFQRLIRGAHDPASATTHDELHLVDGVNRIAVLRRGPALPGDPYPGTVYHLGDHLASSVAVLDDAGTVLNREEFTPYGETAFGGYAGKRYRFCAKERDEESGLAYHGARYYAPWSARWTATDPVFPRGNLNWYRYADDNPLTVIDPSGAADVPTQPVTLPRDAAAASAGPQGQAFRADPFSWEGFKALVGGLTLYLGTPQHADGTAMDPGERAQLMTRNTSLFLAYSRGAGFHTSHALLGDAVPDGAVRSEALQNALALAGPAFEAFSEARQFVRAGADFRAWNAAHTTYQATFRNAMTDAAGRPASAAEGPGLANMIEQMAWRNWKLSEVQFKHSGNQGLDLHFLGAGENAGLRAIGEAKGAGGLGALEVPVSTEILGGFRQGGEMYIGMGLATYIERGGAHVEEAQTVMSMLRSGDVRSFASSGENLWQLNFSGTVDFRKTRTAAKLLCGN